MHMYCAVRGRFLHLTPQLAPSRSNTLTLSHAATQVRKSMMYEMNFPDEALIDPYDPQVLMPLPLAVHVHVPVLHVQSASILSLKWAVTYMSVCLCVRTR